MNATRGRQRQLRKMCKPRGSSVWSWWKAKGRGRGRCWHWELHGAVQQVQSTLHRTTTPGLYFSCSLEQKKLALNPNREERKTNRNGIRNLPRELSAASTLDRHPRNPQLQLSWSPFACSPWRRDANQFETSCRMSAIRQRNSDRY